MNSAFNEDQGQFSKDGRFVAYVSDESGRREVYVRELSANAVGEKWSVSNGGGSTPRWRADAKELFYVSPDRTIMTVDVTAGVGFQAGRPKPSLELAPGVTTWDVTAAGTRFLVAVPVEQTDQAAFTVMLNWQQALQELESRQRHVVSDRASAGAVLPSRSGICIPECARAGRPRESARPHGGARDNAKRAARVGFDGGPDGPGPRAE